MTPAHIFSTLVVLILIAGLMNRRRRSIHVPLMLMAFSIDIGLVIYIESTGLVLEQVAGGFGSMPPVVQLHVGLSLLTLTAYVIQILLGLGMIKQKSRVRPWHRRVGWMLLICRLGNYFTSFLVG